MNGWPILHRIKRRLQRQQAIDGDLAEYLAEAIDRINAGEDASTALGITTTAARRAERDHYLQRSALLMPARWSTLQRAIKMLDASRQLGAFIFKYDELPEVERHPWKRELLEALRHAPLPKLRQLQTLIKNCNSPADCKNRAA